MSTNLASQLAQQFALDRFPENDQERMLNDMEKIVMESVLTRTIPLLSESDGDECDKILASNADIAEVFAFVQPKVAKFQAIVDEEIELLKKTLDTAAH